jgi:hypothetical protein
MNYNSRDSFSCISRWTAGKGFPRLSPTAQFGVKKKTKSPKICFVRIIEFLFVCDHLNSVVKDDSRDRIFYPISAENGECLNFMVETIFEESSTLVSR